MEKKALKIVICGYYGRGNFGDEAILRVILKKIKADAPSRKVRVLKSKSLLRAVRDMASADLFIFGGGSILQNTTSDASLLYYLGIIRASRLLCKRKIMLANGIGPITSRRFSQNTLKKALAKAINCFDFISVRDTDSKKLLKTLLPSRKIHLIPDPALISFAEIKEKSSKINQRLIKSSDTFSVDSFFVYVPRAKSVSKAHLREEELAQSFAHLSSCRGAKLKIIVLNEKEDLPLAIELKKQINEVEIAVPRTAEECARAFSGAKFVISSRYHGSMLASVLQIPSLSVSSDPKIRALCKDLALFPVAHPEVLKDPELLNIKITKNLDYHLQNADLIAQKIKHATHLAKTRLEKILKIYP